MPKEIKARNLEEFLQMKVRVGGDYVPFLDFLLERSREIRVKAHEDFVKIKFRTRKYLWTIKLRPDEATKLLDEIRKRAPHIEIKTF